MYIGAGCLPLFSLHLFCFLRSRPMRQILLAYVRTPICLYSAGDPSCRYTSPLALIIVREGGGGEVLISSALTFVSQLSTPSLNSLALCV